MFPKMRRAGQQLPAEESRAILRGAKSGVLAVCGEDGYPYTVPLNFAYHDGKIVFHSASEGHKLDAIRRCGKVSFCVVAQDEVMPKELTCAYLSVIAFGRARIVEEPARQAEIAVLLGEKYSPGYPEIYRPAIDKALAARKMVCVEISIEHLTGKCGRQVLIRRQRRQAEPDKPAGLSD